LLPHYNSDATRFYLTLFDSQRMCDTCVTARLHDSAFSGGRFVTSGYFHRWAVGGLTAAWVVRDLAAAVGKVLLADNADRLAP